MAVSHGSTIGLFIRKVLGNQEGSTYDIGNCHILKFEYDDNQFKFIEIIDPTTNKLKPLNSYIMGLSLFVLKEVDTIFND